MACFSLSNSFKRTDNSLYREIWSEQDGISENNNSGDGVSGLGNPAIAGRTVTINQGGTLAFAAPGGNAFGAGTCTPALALVINAGGQVVTNGAGVGGNTCLGNVTLNGGTLSTSRAYNTTWESYELGGTVTVAANASTINGSGNYDGLNLGINAAAGYQTTFNVGLTGAGGASSNPDLTVSVPLVNAGASQNATGLIKSGAGMMLLSGSNIYTGPTTISAGTLTIGGAGQLGGGWYAANIANSGAFVYSSTAAQTLSGVISGPGTLTQAGPGTLTLIGSGNTYKGGTTVSGGVLQIAADAQLGAVPAAPALSLTLSGGELFNDDAQLTLKASRNISLGAGGGYFRPGWGPAGIAVNGQIGGPGSLGVVWDGGILLLNGSDSYQGNTTIGTYGNGYWNSTAANPTLRLGNAAALPPTTTVIFGSNANNNTATLDLYGQSAQVAGLSGGNNAVVDNLLGGSATLTFSNSGASNAFAGTIKSTSGAVSLVMSGSGTQVLAGANTYTGGTTISTGMLRLGNAAALGTGGLTIGGGELDLNANSIGLPLLAGNGGTISDESAAGGTTTLTVGQAGNTTFGGTVRDGLNGRIVALAVNGPGMLTLSGSNGYSGGTTIGGGMLGLGSATALPVGGTISFAGGSLQYSPANTVDYSSNFANSTSPIAIDTNGQNVTYAGVIAASNTAGLTKIGVGTLTLSSSPAYKGETTVDAGVLVLAFNQSSTR